MARHGGSDFVAVGSDSYVAGAALGHAIGESIRTQADFNDCMKAFGWVLVTPETEAAQSAKASQWRAAADQAVACASEIRKNPNYAALLPHMPDVRTSEFTMSQLADEGMPSPAESKLVALYWDETKICFNNSMKLVATISPGAVPIFQQLRSDNEQVTIMLVRRQITWGEASRRQKANYEATKANLRASHL